MIGRSIGRFRILAPLGIGGMASVWRARDELLGRELALKILADSLAQSDDSRRRFRHEAHIAAGLDHPGIAAVYDSGDTDGHTWIAMALIEGETLAERIARSLVPVRQVVSTALAVADALGFAHERRVVHRDVTSRNVMLGSDGRIFVLDFGLALAQGASRISSSGTTVGTAPYMAPELLLGATANARSDLYGLGVVMYEALTGALPFPGDRPATAIFARLNQPVRPARELRPEMSEALDAIVLRCLAREPADRFADAGELAAALREVETEMRGVVSSASAVAAAPPAAEPAGAPQVRDGTSAARPRESVIADRLASRTGTVYLAIPPFELIDAGGQSIEETLRASRGLAIAAAAGLSRLQRLHVVPADAPPPGTSTEALRAYARAIGANLVLLGAVRRSGSRLRVTCSLCDPEAGLQLAGDALEGSVFDVFELEDRMLASLRRALASQAGEARESSRSRPSDPAASEHFQQALRYMERHDHEASVDGAIAILERLIESEGDVARYHSTLARACLFKYDLTKQRTWEARAAAAGARAAELAPDAAETLLALGDLHRLAGRFADANREYGLALAQRPEYYEARLGRARALEALGRTDDAEAECSAAIAARPEDWRGHILLGRIRWTRGKLEEALGPWLQVKRLVPDNILAARNLGSALFHLDRFDEALAELQRGLDLRPDAAAFSNLGTALYFLERYEEAVTAFERGVSLLPTDPVKWGNLGNALRFTPGRESEAKPALERAVGLMRERLQRNPGDAEGLARLAGWLVNLGLCDPAREAITAALKRSPEDVHCLVHAGHVFCQLGDRAEALRCLRRAIELGFGPQALARSPDLSDLRSDPEFRSMIRAPAKQERDPGAPGRLGLTEEPD